MKYLPYIDLTDSGSEYMDFWQSVIVISIAYFSVILFSILMVIEIYNLIHILFKQRKY